LVCDTRETTKTIDDIELTVKKKFSKVQDEAIAKYTSLFGVTIDNQKSLKLK
jgi:hypothetical protein